MAHNEFALLSCIFGIGRRDLASALSRASSRRAICRRWTRSLVRMNNTRHPFSTSASPMAAARWLLPPPGGPIGALFDPAIACGERHDLRLTDHQHRLELEVLQRFADGQSCFGEVALDAAATAIGDLMLGERREEASRGPACLVGLLGELGPH